MNLALTFTLDALRQANEDLELLDAEKRRLQDRREVLVVRRECLLAQLELLKSQA